MITLLRNAVASSAVCLLAACATAPVPPTANPADLKPLAPGILPGYLSTKDVVNGTALLRSPPAAGSPQQAADDATYRAAVAARDTPRWKQAAVDADLRFPQIVDSFACALGTPIDAKSTPHLAMLLRRSTADAGLATFPPKEHYKRARPFRAQNGPRCTTDEVEKLNDGSYPSGHAAVGWAAALVLIEVAPDRADALAQRGHAFGQSRVACGVHWQSDVDAGRELAAAVVAQLHANDDFKAQLAEARKELAAARAAGARPGWDCAAEAAALK